MKNIVDYYPDKYCADGVNCVAAGVYEFEGLYFTSLSFEQEPEFGEHDDASDISQHPLEDILHKFNVYVQDYYEYDVYYGSKVCHLEFASQDIENIKALRGIIGKHVYCNNDGELVIE
ncbi:hypothetical protein [Ruminococcus sp.]|uniref:hypothetical protein n=1 Tax=Ruminococcus sp. TaxID=41978 RepID=UPI001B1DE7B9|nr:hypothetical protein [Ruminococcus sp.]MBO5559893.1 hypothetical protein [Ruminococcus sp.]